MDTPVFRVGEQLLRIFVAVAYDAVAPFRKLRFSATSVCFFSFAMSLLPPNLRIFVGG